MTAPKKERDIFRQAIDAAWDHALAAQGRLPEDASAAEVAAVAQAWAAVAVAAKAVLH